MKCRECDCCQEVTLIRWSSSKNGWIEENTHQCWGVKEPFIIKDTNVECTEYPERRNKTVEDTDIEKVIDHFKYGISHDIFKEPVTSYAKMAIEALEKQIPMRPIEVGKYGFSCPCCNEDLGLEKEDIYIYDMTPPNYCEYCGQALDWKRYE